MEKGVRQTVFLLLRTACHLLCLDSTLQRMSSQTQEMRFTPVYITYPCVHLSMYVCMYLHTYIAHIHAVVVMHIGIHLYVHVHVTSSMFIQYDIMLYSL